LTKILIFILFFSISASVSTAEEPKTDIEWLAANIYHEARGEPLVGQYLVAFVTLNRVKHPRFPDTIPGVIKQHKQFSWYNPNRYRKPKDKQAWEIAKIVAENVINKKVVDISKGSIFYHADYVNPYWANKKNLQFKVASHLFYTD